MVEGVLQDFRSIQHHTVWKERKEIFIMANEYDMKIWEDFNEGVNKYVTVLLGTER